MGEQRTQALANGAHLLEVLFVQWGSGPDETDVAKPGASCRDVVEQIRIAVQVARVH